MKKQNLIRIFLFVIFSLSITTVTSQTGRMIKVAITPDHPDWVYKPGEKVKFTITALKNDVPLKNVEVRYEISEDMMKPLQTETTILKNGEIMIDAGTMKNPGFLRCRAFAKYDGREYEGRATAGFSPEAIAPTAKQPTDFDLFWDKAKEDAAQIPMDARVTLLPERCNAKTNVYHVNLQSYRTGTRLYGILSVPKAPGKYPAVLQVPGAGIRSYSGDDSAGEKGVIIFEIGIHGIPVNLEESVYSDLRSGALDGYWFLNLDDKDRYYYKRVYLGCIRAVDYIFSLPEFDGKNICTQGGSQGGALAIVTAALDPRVKGLVSFYPALSDVTGYLHGRAGGWPHFFRGANDKFNNTPQKIETTGYYDVVNFARRLKVPGFYSFGFNDMVCPPTSTYSSYNVVTAPKELFLVEETAHFGYPEQWEKAWGWTLQLLKK